MQKIIFVYICALQGLLQDRHTKQFYSVFELVKICAVLLPEMNSLIVFCALTLILIGQLMSEQATCVQTIGFNTLTHMHYSYTSIIHLRGYISTSFLAANI